MNLTLTCNATLDDLRILPGSERAIVGSLNFHQLALIIGGACTGIALALSAFLVFMHARYYTKPSEQRHIIRIVLMVPIYAISSFLQILFYWHAIYYQVISDCYEAFAIASFFALMCHYIGPDLHEQKEYFRAMYPVKPWVLPINWFAKCCGGQKGIWRTPKSGLTWFNIIWIGIYQYCFIHVAMTITSVVTQYFGRYCESSNSPVFGHIWTIVFDSVAVTIAMYCVIQFYVQLRHPLGDHKPFLKVLSIKLVIFLSFWQTAAISVGTSTLNIVHANSTLGYPDIKVGIPALLLCFEMSLFSILHLWAFPYSPYKPGAKPVFYPNPDSLKGDAMPQRENKHDLPAGGPLGLKAFFDAMNLWDFVKAFGRGMRWLFYGVRHRKEDTSYQNTRINTGLDMDDLSKNKLGGDTAYQGAPTKSTEHLPIAHEFRRSNFGMPTVVSPSDRPLVGEESAGLIEHAQPNPVGAGRQLSPEWLRRDTVSPYRDERDERRAQYGGRRDEAEGWPSSSSDEARRAPRRMDPAQVQVGQALWGPQDGYDGPPGMAR